MFNKDDKAWWAKIIKGLPEDEVKWWIEEIHGSDITEWHSLEEYLELGGYGWIDDTLICSISFAEPPDWFVVKAIRYYLEEHKIDIGI